VNRFVVWGLVLSTVIWPQPRSGKTQSLARSPSASDGRNAAKYMQANIAASRGPRLRPTYVAADGCGRSPMSGMLAIARLGFTSPYRQVLWDLAACGRPVMVDLQVRSRFLLHSDM
jgi:hypothetical protein